MRFIWLVLMLLLPFASAQKLAELAPADSLLTLGWSVGDSMIDHLADDWSAIDWQGAREALDKILLLLKEDVTAADEAVIFDILAEIVAGDFSIEDLNDEIMAEIYGVCPPLESYLDRYASIEGSAQVDALLTVSMNSFSLLPAFTALLQVAKADDERFGLSAFQDVILSCADLVLDVVKLEQNGVPIYVLGDGGDLPLIIAKVADVFVISTNPDVLRGVVRRALGSDELSLASTDLYQRAEAILNYDNSLSMTLNVAALADAAAGVSEIVIDSPETEVLVERGLAFLRTVGGYAGSLYLSDEGVIFENITAVNPEGGDPELAQLLLCQTCAVASPFLVPDGSASTWSQNIPLRAMLNYVQGWLDDAAPLIGERFDIKQVVRAEFGVDLDTALFNWIGEELHWAQLENMNLSIDNWLYGSPQIVFVPVASQEAAQRGLDLWASLLAPYANAIFGLLSGVSGDFDIAALIDNVYLTDQDVSFVQRDYSYRDTSYSRLQAGLNIDIASAFIGNHLVIASPAETITEVIDTFLGGPSMLDSAVYRRVDRSGVTVASSFQDERRFMQASAEFFRLLAQPAAYGLGFLAQEELWYAEPETLPNYGEWLRLTELPSMAMAVLAEHLSTSEATVKVEGDTIHRYGLTRVDW